MAVSLHRCAPWGRWLWRLSIACALAGALHAQSAPPLPLRPAAVAYDAAGNAYFADADRNQIYESTLGGALRVVAGNGTQGFAGDGGPAASAELNAPQGVAFGPAGELYIADTGNQRVRVVQTGTISTFAGSGLRGFGGDGGPATSASFSMPTTLALDAAGALLICDTGNQRVRRVSNGVVTTMAGNGTQGFSGDGAAATAAELDGPQGVAVAADGRVFVADSRNHRIRVIDTSGVITTYAGTGGRGYSGDGGAAIAAQLDLPRGMVVTSSGALVFADSDNRRIRAVSPSGIITTILGAGTQGTSDEGATGLSAWLNAPRSVGLTSLGEVALADAANRSVKIQAPGDALYSAAGLVPSRQSTVRFTGPSTAAYGQWSGQVSVVGSASTPLGNVQIADAGSTVATEGLSGGSVVVALPELAVGAHALVASYMGDGINPAASSAALSLNVGAASVTATAGPASILYGQPVPALTGTLTGVLPQDAGSVTAVFSTAASLLSPVGSYAIAATLQGAAAGNYVLANGGSAGTLHIAQAPSQTALPLQAGGSYAGVPFVLHATVASTTTGIPTGTVSFEEGGVTVLQGALVGGIASATYASATAGSHTLTASYGGDTNFLGSTSSPQTFVIAALPDFTVVPAGVTSQTVTAGTAATYSLSVAANPAPFSGVVSMSVSGLPPGAVATFSPQSLVPGSPGTATTLTITTLAHADLVPPGRRRSPLFAGLLAPVFAMCRRRRGRSAGAILACLLGSFALLVLSGCGARTVLPSTTTGTASTYALTVTGTGTNLAGTVVTHSTSLTLIVD